MDLEDYERNIMKPDDWPYIIKTSGTHSGSNSVGKINPKIKESVVEPPRSKKDRIISENPETEVEDFSKWSPPPPPVKKSLFESSSSSTTYVVKNRKSWNRCTFSCRICQLKSIDSREVRNHIHKEHKMKMPAYTEKYGPIEFERRTFKCGMCESQMKFIR